MAIEHSDKAKETVMARTINIPAYDFSALDEVLPSWADHLVDSPVGRHLAPWLNKVIGRNLVHSATRADLLCLLSAVYLAGTKVSDAEVAAKLKDAQSLRYTTFYRTYFATGNGNRGQLIGVYERNADAEAAAQGKGEWGGPGRVVMGDGYVVGDHIIFASEVIPRSDLNVNLPERLEAKKEAARNKLTPEERQLLGIA